MCREAYESPALPLSYSANEIKLTERDPQWQPRSQPRHTSLPRDVLALLRMLAQSRGRSPSHVRQRALGRSRPAGADFDPPRAGRERRAFATARLRQAPPSAVLRPRPVVSLVRRHRLGSLARQSSRGPSRRRCSSRSTVTARASSGTSRQRTGHRPSAARSDQGDCSRRSRNRCLRLGARAGSIDPRWRGRRPCGRGRTTQLSAQGAPGPRRGRRRDHDRGPHSRR